MGEAIPKGSAVYVRYWGQNLNPIMKEVSERETMGWLAQEIGPYINIQQDRTIESIQYQSGSGSGVLVPKISIIDIYVVEKRESK